jgi:deferrochelatase/peroxidase EfeB
MFGQYEIGTDYSVEEYPSEARYVDIYQQEQAAIDTAVQAQATGSIFDTLKSIVQTVSPLATSIIKATTGRDVTLTPTTPVPTTALTPSVAGITSSPLLMIGIAAGAFMFLRGRGKKKGRK